MPETWPAPSPVARPTAATGAGAPLTIPVPVMRNPAAVRLLSVHAATAGSGDSAAAAARTPKTSTIADRPMARSPFVLSLPLYYAEAGSGRKIVVAYRVAFRLSLRFS